LTNHTVNASMPTDPVAQAPDQTERKEKNKHLPGVGNSNRHAARSGSRPVNPSCSQDKELLKRKSYDKGHS
jgi:hypothetical protein